MEDMFLMIIQFGQNVFRTEVYIKAINSLGLRYSSFLSWGEDTSIVFYNF